MLHLNKIPPPCVVVRNIHFPFPENKPIIPGLNQPPHLEVPYPLTNGGQQLRHASGRCPVHLHSVTCMTRQIFFVYFW